jgi:3D (Asp-Asp-Asp) domain-containing protein
MVRTNLKLLVILFLSLLLVFRMDLQSHATYALEEGSAQAALPVYKDTTVLTGAQSKPETQADQPTAAAQPIIDPSALQVAAPAEEPATPSSVPPVTEPTAVPAPPPLAQAVPVAAPQPMSYSVNPGDSLYSLSTKFGVPVDTLMAENLIEDPHQLAIGQQLQIPAVEAAIPLPDGQQKLIKQVISTTLTAYTAGAESTGKTEDHPAYGITFSGIKAEEGRTIAVDPSVIPLGSQVYIDGVGIRTAEDTGSAVRGARIDVFMDDLGQAVQFGVKRNVKVYLLSEDNA